MSNIVKDGMVEGSVISCFGEDKKNPSSCKNTIKYFGVIFFAPKIDYSSHYALFSR